jgi:hypothetical protein
MHFRFLLAWLWLSPLAMAGEPLHVGSFAVDASPPVGSWMAYDPVAGVQEPLSCRGVVILGGERPIVLCAVDWIGISNGGHLAFREQLADAAGTDIAHVCVHTLHQHDAPTCDFNAEELLAAHGATATGFDPGFAREVIQRAAEAVSQAVVNASPVTHVGLGSGTIEEVASNRRILGDDGKVKVTRYTATQDPAVRAEPVGTIDPQVKLITFWNGDTPLVALTYYATHPQSYYRTGLANPDFPGMARNQRQIATGVPHIHFNGAGGNIGAGKWNDGAPENRQVLADKVAAGMLAAWEATERFPISRDDVAWDVEMTALPVATYLDEAALSAIVADTAATRDARWYAAVKLTWLRRCRNDDRIAVACLSLGRARVLHLPGELFVEYQLAAQAMRPDLFVAMAAYGDYAPGYIGTEIAYSQGGYETSQPASQVAPEVEGVLTAVMLRLLEGRKTLQP